MILRLLVAGLLGGVAAVAAHADPRIATRPYQASSVVTLHGHAGIESTIAFAPDERIENVAVGNSAAWQVTPNKRANLLFVKPSGTRAHTNMTVITDQRTYLFDLVSTATTAPVYMLRFSYPEPPKIMVAAAAVPETVVVAAASTPPAPPAPRPVDLNFDWNVVGDRQLLPTRSFDDGRAVFLQWPATADLPAILMRGDNGVEGPVNYTVQGDYIVVQGVPSELILRAGKRKATLIAPPRQSHATAVAANASAQTASAQQ